MLKRKATAAKHTPHIKRSSSPKTPKLKVPPVRRRFVISSKAVKLDSTKVDPAAPSAAKNATSAILIVFFNVAEDGDLFQLGGWV